MTWNEIKAWLLENGWSLHEPPQVNLTPESAQFMEDCRAGKVVSRPVANGATMIVHMLIRNMRVVIVYPKGHVQRRMTVSPKNVKMQGGMPRGMMLWSDPHSPHYHTEWKA